MLLLYKLCYYYYYYYYKILEGQKKEILLFIKTTKTRNTSKNLSDIGGQPVVPLVLTCWSRLVSVVFAIYKGK